MRIGMIGGGGVGQTLGAALIERGHEVVIGIRTPTEEALARDRAQAVPLKDWVARTDGQVTDFSGAAKFGEVVFNVTKGGHSLEELRAAGSEALKGKVLVDVANPLDF
jgi:8-hydroxy-5-deazaflavin:NADPH oxidoreductase